MIFTKAAIKAMGRTAAALDHADNLAGVCRSIKNPSNFWRMLTVINMVADDGLISYEQYAKFKKILDEAYESDMSVLQHREMSAREISQKRMMDAIHGKTMEMGE